MPRGSSKERCDHCKKWVSQNRHFMGTLEGIVSEGVDINFSICSKCFEKKGADASYWDEWVRQQDAVIGVKASDD